jgi:hypothetical protein
MLSSIIWMPDAVYFQFWNSQEVKSSEHPYPIPEDTHLCPSTFDHLPKNRETNFVTVWYMFKFCVKISMQTP